MEKRSAKYDELMDAFKKARAKYMALVKGAEASHMMLEQYADLCDLTEINESLDAILMEAKERLSDYDEYNEVTSAAISLLNSVKSAIYLSKYVSQK